MKKQQPVRDARSGRLLPGHSGIGSKGPKVQRIKFMASVRRQAEAENIDVEEMLWAVVKRLVQEAITGDVAAAKFIVDRFCGPMEKSPLVQIGNFQEGPPVPSTRELGAYFRKLEDISTGLLTVELDEDKLAELLE